MSMRDAVLGTAIILLIFLVVDAVGGTFAGWQAPLLGVAVAVAVKTARSNRKDPQ